MNRFINKKIILLFLFVVIFQKEAKSQSQQVPFHIQTAFFGKIFNHITPLKNNTSKIILIVFDTDSESDKTLLHENFRQLGFIVKAVKPVEIVMNIADCNVVYFMPGLQIHAHHCREHSKLSLSGTSEHTENGEISVAIGIEQDKPKVFINLSLLQDEKQDVSAALLKISNVYR